MNTADYNPMFDISEPFHTFNCTRDLYYRHELEARYDYLIETSKRLGLAGLNTQNWVDAHRQELSTLQYLLYKVPQAGNGITHIISEKYRHEYCKNFLEAFICIEDAFIAKYIDIETIAANVANDMPSVEVNGRVFYWFNRGDF